MSDYTCIHLYLVFRTLQMVLLVRNLPANAGRPHKRCGYDPWVRKIPWRRAWQPIPVFLSGKFHGQRSLASYNPWSCKESDTTERLPNPGIKLGSPVLLADSLPTELQGSPTFYRKQVNRHCQCITFFSMLPPGKFHSLVNPDAEGNGGMVVSTF